MTWQTRFRFNTKNGRRQVPVCMSQHVALCVTKNTSAGCNLHWQHIWMKASISVKTKVGITYKHVPIVEQAGKRQCKQLQVVTCNRFYKMLLECSPLTVETRKDAEHDGLRVCIIQYRNYNISINCIQVIWNMLSIVIIIFQVRLTCTPSVQYNYES